MPTFLLLACATAKCPDLIRFAQGVTRAGLDELFVVGNFAVANR